MKEDFVKSNVCQSGDNCSICREKSENGKMWRETMFKYFNMPGSCQNFVCPLGKVWGQGKLDRIQEEWRKRNCKCSKRKSRT